MMMIMDQKRVIGSYEVGKLLKEKGVRIVRLKRKALLGQWARRGKIGLMILRLPHREEADSISAIPYDLSVRKA